MATGQEKVNIYLKKFLPQQQMVINFLDYLRNQDIENLKLQYPLQGFFYGNSIAGIGPDECEAATPSLATDGQGNLLKLDPTNAAFTFENALGIPYSVGMRYNVLERGTEINVRTGQIEYTFFKDAIGEKGEPTSILDNGTTLTVNVDSIFEAGVSNAGRKCIIYLKRPVGQADAFYEGVVYWDGANNLVDTTHLIGQTAGLVSIDPADYLVFAPGVTVRRNTDLSIDPLYVYFGIVTGGGAGTTPLAGQIDTSGATVLYTGSAMSNLVDMSRSFLVGGGTITWDLANDELTWSTDLRVKIMSRPFDYQIVGTTITLLDGECFYIDADGVVGGIKVPQIAPIVSVPDVETAQPIAIRIGNDIFFRDGALELEGDTIENTPTVGRLDGTTKDTLDYMGSKNESDSTPDYTNALASAIANIILVDNENLTKGIKRLEQRDDTVTKVKVIDWLTSVLPVTAAVTIDGQVLSDGDRVLFTEPTLNGVYQVAGIGVGATWTKLPVFGNGSLVPVSMSLAAVKDSADEFIRTIYQWTAANGWKPLDSTEIQGEPTGFVDRTKSEFSFTNGTRTFAIQPKAPATYYYFGQKGRIFRKEGVDSVVIPDAEGIHFIYFDGAVLTTTQVFNIDIILAKTFVSTVYWNVADQEAVLLSEERHGLAMDGATHAYLHNTNGCQYNSGLGLGGPVAGDGSADADSQVSVDDGILYDEDIIINIREGSPSLLDQFAGPDNSNVGSTTSVFQGLRFQAPSNDQLGSFVPLIRRLNGATTGNINFRLYESPTSTTLGALLATSNNLDVTTLPIEPAAHGSPSIAFPSPPTLVAGQFYALIMDSATISSSQIRWAINTGNIKANWQTINTPDYITLSNNENWDALISLYSAGGTEIFQQVLSPIAQIPVFYKSGANGDWKKDPATNFPLKAGTARPTFNELQAGPLWATPDASADDKFIAMYIIGTNDINNPIIAIMGQREDDDLVSAQANNTLETLNLDGLPTLEFKALYRIIYQTDSTYTNAIKAKQVEFTDLRFAETLGAGGSLSPSDHNALSGRSTAGSHPSSAISTTVSDFGGAGSANDVNLKSMLKTIDDHFKALRLHVHPSNKQRVILTGASILLNTGTVLEQQIRNLIVKFEGIQIDFQTGEIFESDGVTSFNGGLNDFTPVIPPVGENRWAGLTLLPSTVNPDNTINLQPLILISASDNFRAVFASGTKVGQVKLEEDTGAIADILQSAITQQGVGGGGGGDGTGDANSFLEDLKNRARVAFWRFVTPFIFSQVEDDEEDSANTDANFDIANSEYDFSVGQILATINQLGSRFLGTSSVIKPEADQDLAKIEVWALYTKDFEDPAPIVRASRDGRGEFQDVTMFQHGNSSLWVGELTFAEEAADQNLHELPVADADTQAILTDSGVGAKRAFQFVVTAKEAQKNLTIYLQKTGSPLGKARINVLKDDGGLPSTDPLDRIGGNISSDDIDIAALAGGNNVSSLPLGRVITKPGTYWVEVITDQDYKDSYSTGVDELGLRVDTSGSTPDGAVYDDGPGTWATTAGNAAVYLLEGMPFDLRIEIEASQNDVSLTAMAVFYNQKSVQVQQGLRLRHVERFSGDLDTTEFTIPSGKFLPDPERLEIYDVGAGMVYKYPAFGVDGHRITFASGQFLNPGEEIILIFDQSKGVGFDYSEPNANLMAANGLGSTDASVDKSFNGVGVKNRATDGILYNVVPLPGGVGIEITEA